MALAVLLGVNTVVTDSQTKSAELTSDGGRILELPSGDVQVVDELPRHVSAIAPGRRGPGRRPAPIVLLHCYLCSVHWWQGTVPLLARDHRVVRIDLLGFGGSEKPDGGYAMREQGELVAEALDYIGIRDAIVVGHSMGFDVATALAAHDPGAVAGLVDIDEAPDNASLVLPFEAKLGFVPVLGEAVWHVTPDSAIRDGYEVAFAPGYDVESGFENPDQAVDDFRAMTYTSFDASVAEQDEYVETIPLDERAKQAGVPLLVVFGEEDQTWEDPAAEAQRYADVPGARIEMVAGAGHSPNVEKPEETAQLILEFAQTSGAAGGHRQVA